MLQFLIQICIMKKSTKPLFCIPWRISRAIIIITARMFTFMHIHFFLAQKIKNNTNTRNAITGSYKYNTTQYSHQCANTEDTCEYRRNSSPYNENCHCFITTNMLLFLFFHRRQWMWIAWHVSYCIHPSLMTKRHGLLQIWMCRIFHTKLSIK